MCIIFSFHLKVKFFLCLTNYALRHGGAFGVDIQIRVFLTMALLGGEWRVSRTGALTTGKEAPLPIE
jgi:hypothetical protein